ncbi:MAG: (4Fe-4S)-binding protein [Desulfosporosinus sp. BRH_c37]|nr:MAG: (4Fe-4S)-binding protein [Desulfosporosinus sp. BRH_c37]
MSKVKKKVKVIKIDAEKCGGCRQCEIACSSVHAKPKFSSSNPARARIQVVRDMDYGIFLPVYAGGYMAAECNGRQKYVIKDQEFDECDFCTAACPSRDLFKEPDSGLPLKCDMCESVGEEGPMCVKWCLAGALTLEEREEEVEEGVKPDEMEIAMRSLINKFGRKNVAETFNRLTQKS